MSHCRERSVARRPLRAAAWPAFLLIGLVTAVLAVAGMSHVDGGHPTAEPAVAAPSHGEGPSCHEAGPHDPAATASRVDRGGDPDGEPPAALPAAEPAPVWTAPVVGTGDVRPARPAGGRTHLVLAQISRT